MSLNLLNMLLREVVPDAHAHILPGARGEFGDARAVELRRQPGLRVQTRICPCHVRAVPSILGALLALVGVLLALAVLGIGLAVLLGVMLAAGLLAVGHFQITSPLVCRAPGRICTPGRKMEIPCQNREKRLDISRFLPFNINGGIGWSPMGRYSRSSLPGGFSRCGRSHKKL